MYETETKSENTYGQLVHKIPNLEVKRFCELVITGLSAMQRLLFHQENHGEIHYYSNHQAPQNNKRIYNIQKQHKIVSYVYRISV